jgi:acyl-CoA reductase-like NAD-dependent aldehyde dehydrogenase
MLDKTSGRVVLGGKKMDRSDLFFEFTIVADVDRRDSVMQVSVSD